MPSIDPSLSSLTLNTSEDGLRYLQGNVDTPDINGARSMCPSRCWRTRDNEAGMAAFTRIMADLGAWIAKATAYLEEVYRSDPEVLGCDASFQLPVGVPLVDGPEVIFHGEEDWSILFEEGVFPICEPYGIMVNFQDGEVADFTDLSGVEDSDRRAALLRLGTIFDVSLAISTADEAMGQENVDSIVEPPQRGILLPH